MNIRALYVVCLLGSSCCVLEPAAALDAIAPLPGLDTCVNAALQQRQGVLYAWHALGDTPDASYKIAVITPDGKIADTTCLASSPTNLRFENRVGQRRYEHYKRISIPEEKARNTAPVIFAGNVKLTGMEIDTDVRGHLRYEYSLVLPSGHVAKSMVDTVTGLLVYAEAKE